MAEQLTITITARDGASQTFRAVGQSAQQMGQALDRAGTSGKQGIEDLGRSAETSAQGMQRLKDEATAIGAVMGTLAAGIMAAGSAYRDQERQIDGINRLYGEQADVVLQMAENIQDFTRYSNDAARESALLASSLISNYDLSAEQLSILIERSADLAQIYGFTLPDAVQRTAGAIRGEGEAAERLGLNMSDAAIAARALEAGITNWNVPGALSEAEKAAFRFQVFLEDTEATVGAAAAAADTAGGSFRGFINEVQDFGQAVGGFLGPLGEIGAELAPLALLAPIAGAGLGKLSDGMKKSATASVALRAATTGLSAVFSPLGLAIAGVVAVGALIYENMQRSGEAARNYAESVDLLSNSIEELRIQGNFEQANLLEGLMEGVDDAVGKIDELSDRADDAGVSIADLFDFEGVDPTWFSNILQEDFKRAAELADDVNLRIEQALSNPNIDHNAYNAEVERLLSTIKITAEGSNIDEVFDTILNIPLEDFSIHVQKATAEVANLDAAWKSWAEDGSPFGDLTETAVVSWEDFTKQVEDNIDAQVEAQRRLAEEQQQAREEWIQSALAIGQYDNALSQLNMTGLTGEMGLFAENTLRAGQAFDNTFRVLVTNVQQMGQGVQQATDWMASLTVANEEGIVTVNRLAEAQRITWGEAEAAVTAYNQTLAANADIQDNLLAIQAMQAPFVAQQVEATQAYVQELANMDAATQRTTLAFMDMQTVQQAQELITLGNSAAFDQMGDSGRAAFEATIQGALQVNPLLFNVLETMGIISGTPMDFEVDYSALEGAGSAIEQLTTQVGYLVTTLREIYGLPPIAPEVDMSGVENAASEGGAIGLLRTMLTGLDGYRATPSVEVDQGGSDSTVQGIVDQLAEIDGTTATATVNVIPGSAAVGDGTGGAGNWREMLGLPAEGASLPPITQTVDVQTTGVEDVTTAQQAIADLEDKSVTVSVSVDSGQVGGLFDLLRQIEGAGAATIRVNVEADTSALDTALAGFGLGDGGGGGAAGFDSPTVTVMVDANVGQAQMKIDSLGGLDTPTSVTVMVDADTSAAVAAIGDLTSAAGGVPPSVTITAVALTDGAVNALNNVTSAAQAIPTSESVSVSAPGAGESTGMLNAVTAAANAIPSSESVSVSVSGAGAAIAALQGVAAAANSIPSSVSTTVTTNVVTAYSTIGSPGTTFAQRHGGIPEYATGGVTARMGEAGAELLHFAGGGTAWAPWDALYTVPQHTLVSPANASKSAMGDGGLTVNVNVTGGTFFGVDDLAAEIAGPVALRIAEAGQRRRLALGGV